MKLIQKEGHTHYKTIKKNPTILLLVMYIFVKYWLFYTELSTYNIENQIFISYVYQCFGVNPKWKIYKGGIVSSWRLTDSFIITLLELSSGQNSTSKYII